MKNHSSRKRSTQGFGWLLSLLVHLAVVGAGTIFWRNAPSVQSVSRPPLTVVLLASRPEPQAHVTPLPKVEEAPAIPDRQSAEPAIPAKTRRQAQASRNVASEPVLPRYFVVAELTEVPRLLNDFRTDFQQLVLNALPSATALLVRLSVSGEVDAIFQLKNDGMVPLDEELALKFVQFKFLPGKRDGEAVPSELRYEISDGTVMPLLESQM